MVTKITERKPKRKDNCQSYFSGKNCSTSTATILLMELSLYCLRYYYLKSWFFLSTPLFEWAAISISCSRKTWRIAKKHITNIKVEAYRKNRFEFFTLSIFTLYIMEPYVSSLFCLVIQLNPLKQMIWEIDKYSKWQICYTLLYPYKLHTLCSEIHHFLFRKLFRRLCRSYAAWMCQYYFFKLPHTVGMSR